MHRIPHIAILVILSLALAGCGFQLRGSVDLPPAWEELFLSSESPQSELSSAFRNGLESNGITWVTRGDSEYILHLGREQFERRNLTIGANARVSEFELTMKTRLRITDKAGNEVLPEKEFTVYRTMISDVNRVSSTVEEARLQQREMREELVLQLMFAVRLAAASAPS